MSFSPDILPNVRYRIQNVDFKTYLERRDDTNVVARPLKDVVEQQWIFISSSDGTYSIVSAQRSLGQDSALDAYDAIVGQGARLLCTTPTSGSGKRWRLARDETRPGDIYIVNADTSPEGRSVLLSGQPLETTFKETNPIKDFARINEGYESRWILAEDSATLLPYGNNNYLIRTLTGGNIHSQPSSNTLSVSNPSSRDQQRWKLESKGNGIWTIKNIKEDSFLVPRKTNDDEWEPVLVKSPPDADKNWNIENLGPVNYLLWVDLKVGNSRDPIRFALSLKENTSTVVLRPSKFAQSQIWHIDLSDSSSEPGPPNQILPNLTEGDYQLQNPSASRFLATSGSFVVNSTNQGTYFHLKIAEGGNLGTDRVCISYVDGSGDRQYWEAQYDQAVSAYHVFLVKDSQPVWIIKAVPGTNPPQFRIAVSQDPVKVVMVDLRAPYEDRPYAYNESYSLGNPNWLFVGK